MDAYFNILSIFIMIAIIGFKNPKISTLNEYWSLEDKTRLLGVLRTHGASNLEVICEQMPDKTMAEIQFIVEKFSKAAQTKYIATEWDDSEEPIVDKWAKILKKLNFKHNASVHDVLPRVLKYIALFEDRDIDESTFNVRECYKLLSDIAYGLPSKELDQTENYFLYDCLTKLSLALKKQDLGAYKDYLKTLEDFEDLAKEKPGGLPGNPKKTTTMNPLKIPEECLVFNDEDRQLSEYVNFDNDTQQ